MAKEPKKKDLDSSQKKSTRKVKHSYKSFRLHKRVRHPGKIAKARHLFRDARRHLWKYKKLFLGILLIYSLFMVALVTGFGNTSGAEDIRQIINELFEGQLGQVISGAAVLGLLASNVTFAPSEVASLYQTTLFIIVSLAIIWSLRQTYAKKTPAIRDSFYLGMYPIIPFVLVIALLVLQLMPLAIGNWLFATVTTGGLAATFAEQLLWFTLFFLLSLLSLYMLSSSLFALYIVTLPDMRPMQALRSARELVRFRRWTVLRKVLFLPLAIIVWGIIILLPLAILATPVASAAVLIYSLLSVFIAHTYMYGLYRELL